ncbi:hypothetical protein KA977_09580, partial [Candidatus Dependentiae bacterium]|nr:hypothetical protein [Candidatus Dependentiae bacterium]
DDLIGSFQYMQIVNKMRKDLIGIALNFDRYEWYYAQLKKRYKNLNMPGYQNNSGNEMTKRVIDANIKNKRITSIFSKEGIIQYYDYTPCGIIGVLSEKGIKQELIYDFSFWSKYKISGFDKYKFGMPIENHTDLRLKNIFESYCNSISNLAVYYLHNNKYSEMEKTLQILNSFDKNFPPQYFIRGAYYYQTGKYNEASENFMKVKNLSPGYENIDELLFKCSKKINKSGE